MGLIETETKKVRRVDVHHLDALGYGPKGKFTRRDWRELCLEKLQAGKNEFEEWQKSWINDVFEENHVSLDFKITYSDSSVSIVQMRDSCVVLDFIGQKFDDYMDASDFVFHSITNFSHARFLKNCNFSSVQFEKEVSFNFVQFANNADFNSAIFNGKLDCSNARFNNSDFSLVSFQVVEFLNSTFNQRSAFIGANFNNSVKFEKAIFEKDADFKNSRFDSDASFRQLVCKEGFGFHQVVFNGAIDFSETYLKFANFSSSRFNDLVLFDNCKIKSGVFTKSVFKSFLLFTNAELNTVNFTDSIFCGNVDFNKTGFEKEANFKSVYFHSITSFDNAKFNGACRFDVNHLYDRKPKDNKTIFASETSFENAVFKNVGHFEYAEFKELVPSFLGVDTATTRLEFSDANETFPQKDSSEHAIKSLGHLKRLADEHGQTDQALMFNALELNAKRLSIENKLLKHEMHGDQLIATDWWSSKLNALTALCNYSAAEFGDWCTAKVTHLYEVTSDYGRSFTRPLKVYLYFLLITYSLALLSAANHSPKSCEPVQLGVLVDLAQEAVVCPNDSEADKAAFDTKLHLSGYRAAFEYTLYRSAGVLDFSDNGKATDAVAQRLFGMAFEPWWMRAWGVFKAISTTALLFLMALGLRNKYRVK